MKIFPRTHCPKCNGPVTFFEVMSIVTPFQSIDCSSCGEMLFLKHKVEMFILTIVISVIVFLFSFFVLVNELLPVPATYGAGFLILAAAEFLMTAHIVRKKDLVVRQNK